MEPSVRKNLLRIIGVIVLVLALIGFVLLVISDHTKKQNGHDTQYYDKYSGETISTINGKSPETYGVTSNAPLFLGFQALIDHGFSQDQLDGTKSGITAYLGANNRKVKDISFDVASFKRLDVGSDASDSNQVTFNIVFDFKDILPINLVGDGLSDVTMKFYDSSNKLVFTYSSNPDLSGPSGQ